MRGMRNWKFRVKKGVGMQKGERKRKYKMFVTEAFTLKYLNEYMEFNNGNGGGFSI